MRYAGFVALALLVLGCGPDPNAKLPYISASKTGGAGGPSTGAGGATTTPTGVGGATTIEKGGSGGSVLPGTGGRISGTGGRPGTGGAVGTGGRISGTGGITGPATGGITGATGGTTAIGDGGTTGGGGRTGTGGGGGGITGRGGATSSGIDGGSTGDEPCVPAKTITGSGSGNSGSFGTTGAFCFRTPDNISGWNCSNFTGRTLKVNNVTKTCGDLPLPAKVDGHYYFDASAGGVDYASIYWY